MYTKEQRAEIKANIKLLVAEQKECRRNRKTVHIVGERTMDAGRAWSDHYYNRRQLHYHYIAYAIMRDKTPEWIAAHVDKQYLDKKDSFQMKNAINEILKTYEEAIRIGA